MKYKVLKLIVLLLIIIPFSTTLISANDDNFFGGGSSVGTDGRYLSYDDDYSSESDGSSGFDWAPLVTILAVAGLGIIISVIAASNYDKSGKSIFSQDSDYETVQRIDSGFDEGPVFESLCIERIKKVDRNFLPKIFKKDVIRVFLALQNAWQTKKWEDIRIIESNSLYNMHKQQLDEYIEKHQTNYLVNQEVKSVELVAFKRDGNTDVLTAKLKVSLLDYVCDDDTGKLLKGSKITLSKRTYRLRFIRKKGVKTIKGQRLLEHECPNCGAPIIVNESGACKYCGSVITNGDYNWALNKYAEWNN